MNKPPLSFHNLIRTWLETEKLPFRISVLDCIEPRYFMFKYADFYICQDRVELWVLNGGGYEKRETFYPSDPEFFVKLRKSLNKKWRVT